MALMLPIMLATSFYATRPATVATRPAVLRAHPLAMALTEPADGAQVSGLIEETRDSKAVVVLHFCQSPAFSLSASLVDRTISAYSTSQLYGGAPLLALQIDTDKPGMAAICSEREVSTFPTIQVWHKGSTCDEVAAADLEQKLVSLGVAKSSAKFDSNNFGGTATFESDIGTGKPSATAVDEIDFTGGRALGSTKDGKRGVPNSGARSTRDFFPGLGLDEKPGDNMGKDGTPGSDPKKPRDDRPLGYDP